MGIFRRRKDDGSQAGIEADGLEAKPGRDDGDDVGDDDAAVAPVDVSRQVDRSGGPYDVTEADDDITRLDLGSLRIPGVAGMELRLEVDERQDQVIAATAVLGDSALQLQAFAAPRSRGIWEEVRDEIADSIEEQGGTVEVEVGVFGPELRTRMPSAAPDGRTVFAPARFVGVDGPRWFLRGVISGRAAIEEVVADELLGILRGTVVVRGSEPMAPRELLPLQLPETAPDSADSATETAAEDTVADSPAARTRDLNPFERGPEITEVR